MIKIDLSEALQGIEVIEDRLTNLKPAFAEIGEYMLRTVDNRFESETGYDGQFAPLKPETIAEKRRKRKRDKILQRDGDLRDTHEYIAHDDRVVIGTNRVYAATHHYGDSRRNIPRRRVLFADDRDQDEIVAIMTDWLGK